MVKVGGSNFTANLVGTELVSDPDKESSSRLTNLTPGGIDLFVALPNSKFISNDLKLTKY